MTRRLIYLHGFASSPASKKARYFGPRLTALGFHVDIPALDEGDFEHLTITRQLSLIERLADGAAVSLMGSSMGGYLAAIYASVHLEVERLVLLAPAFGLMRRWPETLGADRVEQWRRRGALDVYHYGEGRDRALDYGLVEDGRRYPDFPDFHQPALIFHGAQDPVVPVSLSREFAAGHPNVRLLEMPSGHELTDVLEPMWEQTKTFLQPIES